MLHLLFLSTLQAEEPQTLYSWLSSQSDIEEHSSFSQKQIPSQIKLYTWDQSAPKAYSRALFAAPSLLSLLNRYELNTKGHLPSLEHSDTQHNIILLQKESSKAQLIYTDEGLQSIFFAIHRSNLSIDSNPFSEVRFHFVSQDINPLLDSCAKKISSIKQDSYGNTITWKGERCFFGNLLLTYQPTEEYPVQAVFYPPTN